MSLIISLMLPNKLNMTVPVFSFKNSLIEVFLDQEYNKYINLSIEIFPLQKIKNILKINQQKLKRNNNDFFEVLFPMGGGFAVAA